jgi:hypothetical protein
LDDCSYSISLSLTVSSPVAVKILQKRLKSRGNSFLEHENKSSTCYCPEFSFHVFPNAVQLCLTGLHGGDDQFSGLAFPSPRAAAHSASLDEKYKSLLAAAMELYQQKLRELEKMVGWKAEREPKVKDN